MSVYRSLTPKYSFSRYSSKQLISWYQGEALRYARLNRLKDEFPPCSSFHYYCKAETSRISETLADIADVLLCRGFSNEYIQFEFSNAYEDVNYGE